MKTKPAIILLFTISTGLSLTGCGETGTSSEDGKPLSRDCAFSVVEDSSSDLDARDKKPQSENGTSGEIPEGCIQALAAQDGDFKVSITIDVGSSGRLQGYTMGSMNRSFTDEDYELSGALSSGVNTIVDRFPMSDRYEWSLPLSLSSSSRFSVNVQSKRPVKSVFVVIQGDE